MLLASTSRRPLTMGSLRPKSRWVRLMNYANLAVTLTLHCPCTTTRWLHAKASPKRRWLSANGSSAAMRGSSKRTMNWRLCMLNVQPKVDSPPLNSPWDISTKSVSSFRWISKKPGAGMPRLQQMETKTRPAGSIVSRAPRPYRGRITNRLRLPGSSRLAMAMAREGPR